jgi:glycosyltransferase involved in cell wall biosynthesis
MNILALEPYFGGSHKAFLQGWAANSVHTFQILSLPPYKWKWRMRHAAITFAEQITNTLNNPNHQKWDIIFCSDMLNLAETLGLLHYKLPPAPTVAYFHENQLTYPVRFESERDYQYVLTNMTTALSAQSVWFNSAYHRDSFLNALDKFLRRMPDNQPLEGIEKIRQKSSVIPQGIEPVGISNEPRKPGPLRILWCARWEHDKNPQAFFQTLHLLEKQNINFNLIVVGQHFREIPSAFKEAEKHFALKILTWGYQETTADYRKALQSADVVVSTANHEFFGQSVVEAISAGAYPLLPNRLAYPEILQLSTNPQSEQFFYDGTDEQLAQKLTQLARSVEKSDAIGKAQRIAEKIVRRFYFKNLTKTLDDEISKLAKPNNLKQP